MMRKNNIVASFIFVFLSALVVTMFYFAQLNRNYMFTLLALFSYATLLSLLVVLRQTKYVILLLIIWEFIIWHLYYIVLTPNWILANGDLILMSKVSEETVSRGFYPFNDETFLSIRSNYVLYPTPFMLQAILSIITSIDTQMLMYVPILMYATYILVIILTILLVKETPSVLLPFVISPLLSFVGPKPTYFVYSHVSRALLFLFLYIYVKVFFSQKSTRYVVFTLLLLAISFSLGHSQEPIAFSIFLTLLTIMVLLLIPRIKGLFNILIPKFIFISLTIIYNIYIAIFTFRGIALFFKQLLLALIPETSIEAVNQKVSIAQGILTREELALVALGFGIMTIYMVVILLRRITYALNTKNVYAAILDLAILMYGGIALLPLIIPGIGADLFWRPLWTLFIALALWPSTLNSYREEVFRLSKYKQRFLIASVFVMMLFTLSNIIYMRTHLISSSVYTHEALTINTILKSSVIEYLRDIKTKVIKVIVVDSPYQPAYEVYRALMYLLPDIRIEGATLVLQPSIKSYVNLTYLNGLAKLREYNMYVNVEREAREIRDSYIFASTHDISLISDILTSKNIIFNLRDIVISF
jgi:hypothetical protein